MRTIRLKTADLFEFDGAPLVQTPDFATITTLVLKQFGFLPQPVLVRVEGDEVVIQYEIALLGRNGLDYAAPDEKYELRALPDRKFSGLHLMCLMFAGFKRFAPEHEVQMDLNDPFLTALQMHKNGGDKH